MAGSFGVTTYWRANPQDGEAASLSNRIVISSARKGNPQVVPTLARHRNYAGAPSAAGTRPS
jgi:hypothetical protein